MYLELQLPNKNWELFFFNAKFTQSAQIPACQTASFLAIYFIYTGLVTNLDSKRLKAQPRDHLPNGSNRHSDTTLSNSLWDDDLREAPLT